MTDATSKVLVLVPFPMTPEQLAKRTEQQDEVELPLQAGVDTFERQVARRG